MDMETNKDFTHGVRAETVIRDDRFVGWKIFYPEGYVWNEDSGSDVDNARHEAFDKLEQKYKNNYKL